MLAALANHCILKTSMIQSRCLQRSIYRLKDPYSYLTLSSRLGRNFSSNIYRASITSKFPTQSLLLSHRQWQKCQCELHLLPRPTGARYASTGTNTAAIAEFQPDKVPPSDPYATGGGDVFAISLDGATDSMPAPVNEHIGFLKELGLDYGWGTTSMVQWLLEHVHIYAGTPWWGSIALTILIARAGLLKFFFDAADTNARAKMIEGEIKTITANMTAAKASGDTPGFHKHLQEFRAIRKAAGVSTSKQMLPFLQIPIAFGTFRLLRGMANLPVPGLETGGFLWLQDLTLCDPYLILPIATATAYMITFRFGGETGSASAPMNPWMQKAFAYVLPPLGGLLMLRWPAALQLTFFSSALLALIQSTLLKQPWFRDLIGITQLPHPGASKATNPAYMGKLTKYQPPTPPNAPEDKKEVVSETLPSMKSIKSGISDWWETAKQVAKEQQNPQVGRRSGAELKYAKEFHERREREIGQERAMKKLEKKERSRQKRERSRH